MGADIKPAIDWLYFENIVRDLGHIHIAGMDEAGCGPLAGPVVAACVLMPPDAPLIPGINDSKKLTPNRRESLAERIHATALAIGVGYGTHEEIDRYNIRNATRLAMERAYASCAARYPIDYLLVDASPHLALPIPALSLIRGDARSYAIAAASIIAKTERDAYMRRLNTEYPEYGFSRHMGYPTEAHYAALDHYGPCPHHRETFLRKWHARNQTPEGYPPPAKG